METRRLSVERPLLFGRKRAQGCVAFGGTQAMYFSFLWRLFKSGLLATNAVAILHKQRFLRKCEQLVFFKCRRICVSQRVVFCVLHDVSCLSSITPPSFCILGLEIFACDHLVVHTRKLLNAPRRSEVAPRHSLYVDGLRPRLYYRVSLGLCRSIRYILTRLGFI